MTLDQAARILYMAYNSDGYGRSWANATDKPRWRHAAASLIRALEES